MKKLFTLVAGLLFVSSGAFAQDKWTNVITNGDMEGAADPMWSSFWCHDWRQGVEFDEASGQSYADPSPNATVENPPRMFQGFAEIVDDPANPGNHCARVVIRTKEEADASGTATTDTGNSKPEWTEWDSQFFIYATEPMPEGKEVRLTLKIRGEKAGSLQTQAHFNPGNYNHYSLFGDINYTTAWSTVTVETVISSDHVKESDGKAFQSVAFNLSTMQDGNTVYFDDVKLEIRDPKDPAEFEGWFNFLRNGTLSEDAMPQNNKITNFTARNGIDGIDRKAEVITDADGKPAMKVTTVIYEKTEQVPVLDEEGNPKLDDNGEPTYEEKKYWTKKLYNDAGEARDTLMCNDNSSGVIQDWQTQFFVSIPHTLGQNQKYKVKFSARADRPTQIQSQVHAQPGGYLWYEAIGNFDLTEEWQEFDTDEKTIGSNQKGTWTIAFNCNQGKDDEAVNNIYFRFEEFSINSAEVKEEDIVLASGTALGQLPEMGATEPTQMKVDLTDALAALGVDKASDLMDGIIKVSVKDADDNIAWQETQPDFFVNADGFYNEEDGINIAYNEDDSEGNIVAFDIFNDKTEVNGTVPVKLIFKKYEDASQGEGYARRGWNYLLNLSLMNKAAYEEAMGVSVLKNDVKADGAIYDLSGRRVAKAAKGLYIKDGKKFVIK